MISGRAVGPEDKIVGLRSHQTQVECCGQLTIGAFLHGGGLLFAILRRSRTRAVDLKQATVDFRPVAEVCRRGTGLHPLRDGNGNGLGGRSVGNEPLVLLTRGKCCQHSRQ